jgi:hypothetical protein
MGYMTNARIEQLRGRGPRPGPTCDEVQELARGYMRGTDHERVVASMKAERAALTEERDRALEVVGLVEDYIAAWESEVGTEECIGYVALKRRQLFAAWRKHYEERSDG